MQAGVQAGILLLILLSHSWQDLLAMPARHPSAAGKVGARERLPVGRFGLYRNANQERAPELAALLVLIDCSCVFAPS